MSLLDLSRQGAQELEALPVGGIRSLQEYDFTVDVSGNDLTSLSCRDERSAVAALLSQAEIIVAQQNDLRDLLDVQFTFPNLIVLDVSENSLETITAEDQACLAEVPTLDTFIAAANSMLNFSFAARWESLKVIDLSANALKDVPTFGSYCPNLITVDLSRNEIDSLAHLASKLPPALEQLYLNDNMIEDDWHRLAQLTSLAESLTVIHVQGNYFCERVKFSWRIFLVWLLPNADDVDGLPISEHERDAAIDLFKDPHNASIGGSGFSMKFLSLMDEGNEVDLESYLNSNCRVHVRPNHPRRISPAPTRHIDPQPQQQPSTSRRGRSPQPSPQKPVQSRLPSNPQPDPVSRVVAAPPQAALMLVETRQLSQPASAAGSSSTTTQALQQLQTKMKALQDIVKVLRQTDLSRRVFAAVVIQKYFRSYRVRKFLKPQQRLRLKDAHRRTLVGFNKLPVAPPPLLASSSSQVALIDGLQRQVASLASDMSVVRRIADNARAKAAKTIQTYYRGYRARKAFQSTKAAYKKFTAQYVAPATKIQSVIRMHLQRRRFLIERTKHRELEGLKADNKAMKDRLRILEEAMGMMLSRLETVEQLALLGQEDGLEEELPVPQQQHASVSRGLNSNQYYQSTTSTAGYKSDEGPVSQPPSRRMYSPTDLSYDEEDHYPAILNRRDHAKGAR